jgi:hypothetical protein
VCSASHPAHDLDHHHSVVAHGGGVDLVETLSRGVHRGLEAERALAAFKIVVDGLGHPDAVDAMLDQVGRAGHGAVAPDAHHRIDVVGPKVVVHTIRHIHPLGFSVALEGEVFRISLIAGAQNGAAHGEDVGNVVPAQQPHAVLDKPQEPVLDTEDLEAIDVHGRLGYGPQDRVEARAVATAREHADALDSWHGVHCTAFRGGSLGVAQVWTAVVNPRARAW